MTGQRKQKTALNKPLLKSPKKSKSSSLAQRLNALGADFLFFAVNSFGLQIYKLPALGGNIGMGAGDGGFGPSSAKVASS